MKPIELIRIFVEQRLDGDIEEFATFELGRLRGDNTFGCPGRKDDSDDTELMRAVYCVVFDSAWTNLSMDNLGDGTCYKYAYLCTAKQWLTTHLEGV